MTQYLPILGAGVLLFAVAISPLRVRVHVFAIGLLVAMGLLPWRFSLGPVVWHVGVDSHQTSPWLYWVPVLLIALFADRRARAPAWLMVYLIATAVFFLISSTIIWEGLPNEWSGAIHYIFGAFALVAGYRLQVSMRFAQGLERTVVVVMAVTLILQVPIELAQLAGIPLTIFGDLKTLMVDGRPIGTFNHPTAVGKVAVLLAVPLLMGLGSEDPKTRRWVWVGLTAGFFATALTVSRANLVAVVMTGLIWALLARQSEMKVTVKVLSGIALILMSIPFVGLLVERSLEESTFGGGRSYLIPVGLDAIGRSPLTGVGPNNYVEGVGVFDPVVASGVPVHSAPLFIAGEIGIPGAILLMLPLVVVAVSALGKVRADGETGAASRAFTASFPGMMLIALTGWGMLGEQIFALWWFVVGYSGAPILGSRPQSLQVTPTDHVLSRQSAHVATLRTTGLPHGTTRDA